MSESTMKECNRCHQLLPLTHFTKQVNAPDGLRYACKMCTSKRFQTYYQANLQSMRLRDKIRYPEERDLRLDAHYKRKYGISITEYHELLEKQNGVCAICGKTETANWKGRLLPLAVDHSHKTGNVRGLLCNRCNRVLGLLDDDIELLTRTIDYLRNFR